MTIELAEPDTPAIHGTWTVTYYPDKGGRWRWRLKAPNGKIFAVSGQSFANKANAQRAANRLAHLLAQDMQVEFGERRERPATGKAEREKAGKQP